MNTVVPVRWFTEGIPPCGAQTEYVSSGCTDVHACAQAHVHLCVTMHSKMFLHQCLRGLRYSGLWKIKVVSRVIQGTQLNIGICYIK